MVNPFKDEVKVVSIQGGPMGDGTVRDFKLNVSAVNAFAARQKARRFIRMRHPTAKNVLSPDVKGEKSEKQTTFREIFPDSFHTKTFRVEVTVII